MSAAGMASAGGAIDYIASDLSFTISYQIARELLDVAHESDMSDDALPHRLMKKSSSSSSSSSVLIE